MQLNFVIQYTLIKTNTAKKSTHKHRNKMALIGWFNLVPRLAFNNALNNATNLRHVGVPAS